MSANAESEVQAGR